MALVDIQNGAETQNSPNLTTTLPSNNPFRNRAASPASYHSLPSPQIATFSLPAQPPEKPVSRNPFLDQTPPTMPATRERMSPTKPAFSGSTAELFVCHSPVLPTIADNLTLHEKSGSDGPRRPMGPPPAPRLPRPENVPPGVQRPPGLPRHPSRSEEEQRRLRIGSNPRGPPQGSDVFADPPDPRRRLRRNSDSSLASKTLGSEEDRKRRERRHREREGRRNGKLKPHGTSSRSKKPNQRLDIIDSLDVTSIYGTGLFHHDGPFDACNPHRNRKGAKVAPMQAFAKDSINNTLGGSGPVNKDLDLVQFHGHGAEGFTDYSASGANHFVHDPEPYAGAAAPIRRGHGVRPGVDRTSSYNPTKLIEPVHGDESLGLGTSTFLEGAPAPRAAIERRESESEGISGSGNGGNSGGLGRKRSLAQKIRGISNGNRNHDSRPRVTSPDATYERTTSPTSPGEVQSGGGMPKIRETRPFFNDYDEAYERKGQQIKFAEEQNRIEGDPTNTGAAEGSRARAISSPKRNARGIPPGILERRVTHDGAGAGQHDGSGETDGGGKKEGFLSRVRSLKGGRRARPERRESGTRGKSGGGKRPPPSRDETISKAMSYVLRHGAEKEGLKLNEGGYVNCGDL
ncbi:MAG: hypothetical protein Q9194_004204, partial [Teloschistes cf. exilis]